MNTRDEIMESIHHDKMMNTSQDYFNEMVEQEVNELMAPPVYDKEITLVPAGECFPFSPDNLAEALANMDAADTMLMSAYAKAYNDLPANVYLASILSDFVLRVATDYWYRVATNLAREKLK